MNRREFLKKSLERIIISSIPLICDCGKNPIAPYDEYGKLSIKTEKDIYTWNLIIGEFTRTIHINGTLENISTINYYSKMGEVNGPFEQEPLYIAGNSAGYLEKYNEVDSSWYEINILRSLIGGSKFVFIRPSKLYRIYSILSLEKDEEEKGKYRFRIDYYDDENLEASTLPYKDYSNTFEIE